MEIIEADYCIVGGGAAGCVVAARLSEDPSVKVVLLEAGPIDWHPFIHIPAACLFLQHDERFNWLDATVPQAALVGRRVKIAQGRVLGGSGSINGMLHVRPQPEDIAAWNTEGWSYQELLPVLDASETYAQGGNLRGADGPLPVTDFSDVHPLTQAFIDACGTGGVPFNKDMNGPARGGAAFFQQNRKGRFRSQTAQTYLRGARHRANLTVLTGAQCKTIRMDGNRADGVLFDRHGKQQLCRVRREVIVCSGALRSPHLLQNSGIGDPAHLAGLGITPIVEAPQVGRNLRDHFLLRVSHRVKGIATINERTRGLSIVREVMKYVFKGDGMLTMGAGAAAALLPSGRSGDIPDIQLSFAPGSFAGPGVLETEPGMTIGGWMSPGHSRGSVLAVSSDPMAKPAIDPNYLSDERDRAGIVAIVRQIRKLFEEPALARWSAGETYPGPDVGDDDQAIFEFAQQRGGSGYHFAGTCRMGDDSGSVVDNHLRVRGTRGLRVIDASVMPIPPIGNAHATIVMVAEKGATLVKQDAKIQSAN